MMWINSNGQDYEVGQIGFLIKKSNPIRHTESHILSQRPPSTNQSHQPRVHGWCGSWNDTNTYGLGVWRVARVCKNGRVQLTECANAQEVVTFLAEVGFPDLLDACLIP